MRYLFPILALLALCVVADAGCGSSSRVGPVQRMHARKADRHQAKANHHASRELTIGVRRGNVQLVAPPAKTAPKK